MLKKLFDFYIRSSIHVSLAVVALTVMTCLLLELPLDQNLLLFVFLSSVVGYNYAKYPDCFLDKKQLKKPKAILWLSVFCAFGAVFFFFTLNTKAQIAVVVTGLLTLFYVFPLFNFRNLSGVKIYIVALCWVIFTLLLPVFQAGFELNSDVFLKCMQRFLLIIILILIFEIIDLKEDNPELKTVPQTIGVKNTKILGIILLCLFYGIEFFVFSHKVSQFLPNGILAVIIILFLLFASEKKSKYYTTFWVESLPMLWLWLTVWLSN